VALVLLVWALRSENTPSLELLVVGVVNRVDGGGNEAYGEVVAVATGRSVIAVVSVLSVKESSVLVLVVPSSEVVVGGGGESVVGGGGGSVVGGSVVGGGGELTDSHWGLLLLSRMHTDPLAGSRQV
jgi:hypothetical protein